MSDIYKSILEAARRLPPDQQRLLAKRLLTTLDQVRPRGVGWPGKARLLFGAWDSGDNRSADNERIDHDIAQSYGDSHRP